METYGNEKPEGGDQQLNNTFRRAASVRGTPTKLPISFSLLNTWLADSEHELVSFLSLLQKSLSLDELHLRLRCTTTNLSIFPRTLLTITEPEIRTTGGTTPIVTHCTTRAEFYVIACMKRFVSMPLWLMNRNVFIEKRHSARVSYSFSTICLLQLKCTTRNATR